MYTIILGTGERLSSSDLRNINNLKRLSSSELSILKYLKDDIEKINIRGLEEERWYEFNRKNKE